MKGARIRQAALVAGGVVGRLGRSAWAVVVSHPKIMRLVTLVDGKIVVMPLEVHGETRAESLGSSMGSTLAFELERIREIYSAEAERLMAERLTNLPLFARVVVMQPTRAFTDQPHAVELKPLEIGPVSLRSTAWRSFSCRGCMTRS